MTELRGVRWGEGFIVAAFRVPGGVKGAVDRITANIGPTIGNRNTFAKLQHVEDPAQLSDRDRWRAWLLITALGRDPQQWDISDDVVPGILNPEELRIALRPGVEPPEGIEPSTYSLVVQDFSRPFLSRLGRVA